MTTPFYRFSVHHDPYFFLVSSTSELLSTINTTLAKAIDFWTLNKRRVSWMCFTCLYQCSLKLAACISGCAKYAPNVNAVIDRYGKRMNSL